MHLSFGDGDFNLIVGSKFLGQIRYLYRQLGGEERNF